MLYQQLQPVWLYFHFLTIGQTLTRPTHHPPPTTNFYLVPCQSLSMLPIFRQFLGRPLCAYRYVCACLAMFGRCWVLCGMMSFVIAKCMDDRFRKLINDIHMYLKRYEIHSVCWFINLSNRCPITCNHNR